MKLKSYRFFLLLFILPFFQNANAQNCGNAEVYDIFSQTTETFTIVEMDNSAFNLPSCDFDGDEAVWIEIDIPANVAAATMMITLFDYNGCSGFFCQTNVTGALYSGSCASLTAVDDCIDLSTGVANVNAGPWSYAITPGTTYYFRLSEEDDQGGFAELLFELDSYALPVELSKFEGEPRESGNLIKWETASETNVDKFILEKSIDGVNWENMNEISAAGESDIPQFYEMLDRTPQEKNYYRLRIEDLDDYFEYSDIIFMENTMNENNPIELSVFPNPNHGKFSLQFSKNGIAKNKEIMITNSIGKMIYQEIIILEELENRTLDVDLSEYGSGMYFLTFVQDDGKIFSKSLIIH